MILRPPRSTRTDTLFPDTTLFRSRDAFLSKVAEILDNQWLTNNGPTVQEFEQRIAAKLGVKHCVAMCNGTIALEIAIRALKLEGEVIVPSWTFIATAHA